MLSEEENEALENAKRIVENLTNKKKRLEEENIAMKLENKKREVYDKKMRELTNKVEFYKNKLENVDNEADEYKLDLIESYEREIRCLNKVIETIGEYRGQCWHTFDMATLEQSGFCECLICGYRPLN